MEQKTDSRQGLEIERFTTSGTEEFEEGEMILYHLYFNYIGGHRAVCICQNLQNCLLKNSEYYYIKMIFNKPDFKINKPVAWEKFLRW